MSDITVTGANVTETADNQVTALELAPAPNPFFRIFGETSLADPSRPKITGKILSKKFIKYVKKLLSILFNAVKPNG